MPDAARLHRGSKHAGRVAVYTHRDPRQWLAQLSGVKIHRASEIPIRAFDRGAIDELVGLSERRMSWSLSVSDGDVYVSIGARTFAVPVVEYRIPA
jgi:uncharacterized protein YaeQ